MIRIYEIDISLVQTPPSGRARIFLDSNDNMIKAKLDDGSIIILSVTSEYVEDIVGNLFGDSSTIDFTYNDSGNVASMDVILSALDISQIPNIPSGNLTSTNVQDALNELQSDIDSSSSSISSHLDGGPSKHDASEIDYEQIDGSKISIQSGSDDVESALIDLDNNKLDISGSQPMTGNLDLGTNNITNVNLVDGRDLSVDGSKLDTIELNAKDDQIASEVPVTPTGNISSTDVQSALVELQTDIDNILLNSIEAAQDAVGTSLTDSSTIDFTYNDPANTITADVIQSGIDHGSISGLADDDHTQYHNDARGDARYYTETELDAGQLDNRYYTETEVDALLALQDEAVEISYDDSITLLGATDVQAAIEQLKVLFTKEYFQSSQTASQTGISSDTVLSSSENQNSNLSVFSFASNELTINKPGKFKFDINISADTATGSRETLIARLQRDTGSGFNDIPVAEAHTYGYSYHRNAASGEDSIDISPILTVTSGDKFRVVLNCPTGSIDTIPNGTGISVEEK